MRLIANRLTFQNCPTSYNLIFMAFNNADQLFKIAQRIANQCDLLRLSTFFSNLSSSLHFPLAREICPKLSIYHDNLMNFKNSTNIYYCILPLVCVKCWNIRNKCCTNQLLCKEKKPETPTKMCQQLNWLVYTGW